MSTPAIEVIPPLTIKSQGGYCAGCFQKTELTKHHIKPLRSGGSNASSNLVGLCRPCHDQAEARIRRVGNGNHRHMRAFWSEAQRTCAQMAAIDRRRGMNA